MKPLDTFITHFCAQLRLCLHCRAFLPPCDPFCPKCWQYLLTFKNRHLKTSPIHTDYLLAWTQNEAHPLIKGLIYFLKHRRHTQAYEQLAQRFVPRALPPRGAVFVPAPTLFNGQANHALYWAQALAQNWQGQVVCALKHKSKAVQKQASMQKRRQIQLRCVQAVDASKHIVFCDDLVTTGATSQAAWRALGQPQNFKVWSIAYRPLLNKSNEQRAENKE